MIDKLKNSRLVRNISKLLFIIAGCFVLASFSPSLDGRAIVVDEGVFPQGLFAKTVGYLPGDIISVTNITGDATIDILVIGALDPSEGVAIMLSPEAAAAIGIEKGSNNIVKITKRSNQDERVYGSAVIAAQNSSSNTSKTPVAEKEPVYEPQKPVETYEEPAYEETSFEESAFEETSAPQVIEAFEEETETEEPIFSKPVPTYEEEPLYEEPLEYEAFEDDEIPEYFEPEDASEYIGDFEQDYEPEVPVEETPALEENFVEEIEEEELEPVYEAFDEDELEALPLENEVEPAYDDFEETFEEESFDEEPESTEEDFTEETFEPEYEEPLAEEFFEADELENLEEPEETVPAVEESEEPEIEDFEEEDFTEEDFEEETFEDEIEEAPLEEEFFEADELDELAEEEIAEQPEENLEAEESEEDIEDFEEETFEEEEFEEESFEEESLEEIEEEYPDELAIDDYVEDDGVEFLDEEEPEEELEPEYEGIVLVPADENPPVEEEDELEDLFLPELNASIAPIDLEDISYEEDIYTEEIAETDSVEEDLYVEDVVVPEIPVQEVITVRSASKETSYDKYLIDSLDELEDGLYYIQIATLKEDENILEIVNQYGKRYPLTIVPTSKGTKQILVGPVTLDEYATVLERFKSYGYKDAFLRKGTNPNPKTKSQMIDAK